jgi:hypothetical protein
MHTTGDYRGEIKNPELAVFIRRQKMEAMDLRFLETKGATVFSMIKLLDWDYL